MAEQNTRSRTIRIASWIGIAGNGILSVTQLIFGFWGGSLALVGAGIDSVTDVATSIITLFTGRIIDQPPDDEHPYGHDRAETIATKLLSFIIFFAGAQLLISTLGNLIRGEERALPASITMIIAVISVGIKIALALVKWRAGKKAESSMLIADAKNMSMDVAISASVFLGILFSIHFGLPLIDSLLALAVGGWIMWVGYGIFMETNAELMDGLEDREIYRHVCRAVLKVKGASNPHKMRIRKLNTRYIIDLDIEVYEELTVREGHKIAMQVEQNIFHEIPNVYDVQVHVEPVGNRETKERFGLSRDSLQNGEDPDSFPR